MIDENALKLEARLCAIEFAICDLFSVFNLNMSAKQIHQRHDQLLKRFQERGVTGVDPVMSDLIAGDAENALRELLGLIELHSQKPRSKVEK